MVAKSYFLNEMPINVMQEIIYSLRYNEGFEGKGKVNDKIQITKTSESASVVYIDDTFTYLTHLYKKDGEWFFDESFSIIPKK